MTPVEIREEILSAIYASCASTPCTPTPAAMTRQVDTIGIAPMGDGNVQVGSIRNAEIKTPMRPTAAIALRAIGLRRLSNVVLAASNAPAASSQARANVEKYATVGSLTPWYIAQPNEAMITTAAKTAT